MRIFVTGATGFVGSAVVAELLTAGHEVLGLVRSEEKARAIIEAGAAIVVGDVNDTNLLKRYALECDAVIHTAFNHDFSKFKQNCEDDRQVILALGEACAGTTKPIVVTSGIGILKYDRMVTESDELSEGSGTAPRAATEEAAAAAREMGANVYVVRLPPTVHGAGDHGFIYMLGEIARAKGMAGHIGEGQNRWPAVHRLDAAKVYRLIVERSPEQKIYHAVAEEGIPFVHISATIANGLSLPDKILSPEEAVSYFDWFSYFAAFDCPASADLTKQVLGWQPENIPLLEDINKNYF